LRFGKQPSVKLEYVDERTNFEYLDGAFLAVSTDDPKSSAKRLRLGLTTVREDESGMMAIGYFLDFRPETQGLLVSDAIDKALESRREAVSALPGDSDNERALKESRKERYAEAANLLRQGARLVFNSIFYIESIESKAERSPGRDVPLELKTRWAEQPLRREKLKSKLTADGFTVVRLLGKDFPDQEEDASCEGSTGTTVRAHWRRAHWRQQACGEGLRQHKRIRIPKVLVNRDTLDGEMPGRIYKTE
jgi:hypothetical protein